MLEQSEKICKINNIHSQQKNLTRSYRQYRTLLNHFFPIIWTKINYALMILASYHKLTFPVFRKIILKNPIGSPFQCNLFYNIKILS